MRILINIFFKKSTNGRLKKKKKNDVATVAIVPLEQTKSTVTFIHSPNKYHNIFTKYLFSVVVGHISYFIILFWLIRNWNLSNCENIVKFIVSI